MTVADAFETIVTSCIRHFRLNEPLVIEYRDVEGLHQIRVAMRRLAGALSLFKPAVADAAFGRMEASLDWFTRELGEARNFDIFLQRNLPPGERRIMQRNREEAYDAVIAAITSQRLQHLMQDLPSWAGRGEWRSQKRAAHPIAQFVNPRIDRLWKRVSQAGKLTQLTAKKRHKLRIRAKKLRYSLEFVRDIHPHRKRRLKFGDAVKRLQDELGEANDFIVARDIGAVSSLPVTAREKCEIRAHVRSAQRALRRMRRAGPYWRG